MKHGKKTYRDGADATLVVYAVHATAAASNLDISCTAQTHTYSRAQHSAAQRSAGQVS